MAQFSSQIGFTFPSLGRELRFVSLLTLVPYREHQLILSDISTPVLLT